MVVGKAEDSNHYVQPPLPDNSGSAYGFPVRNNRITLLRTFGWCPDPGAATPCCMARHPLSGTSEISTRLEYPAPEHRFHRPLRRPRCGQFHSPARAQHHALEPGAGAGPGLHAAPGFGQLVAPARHCPAQRMAGAGHSAIVVVSLLSASILAGGYIALAAFLQRRLLPGNLLDDRASLLAWILPVTIGTFLVSTVYLAACACSVCCRPTAGRPGILQFWVGDSVGIAVAMPLFWWLSASAGGSFSRQRRCAGKRPPMSSSACSPPGSPSIWAATAASSSSICSSCRSSGPRPGKGHSHRHHVGLAARSRSSSPSRCCATAR